MHQLTTGNADADQINSNVSHNIGMVFQGAWDIVGPFVAAGVIIGLFILAAVFIVKKVTGGAGRR